MVIGAANIVASPSKKDSTNIEGTHDELSNT